jgi:hypothetical protein
VAFYGLRVGGFFMKSFFWFGAVVVAGMWNGSALAGCSDVDLSQVKANIAWCGAQCGSSGHQKECNGNGYMGTHAKNGDANGVREGFEQCHDGNGGQIGQMQACFRERQTDFLHIACEVYGCVKPTPSPTPEPVIKNIDFNKPMTPATDNKNIVIADFTLPGTGEYRSVTINFTRDNVNVFNLSTYAVNFDSSGGQLHLTITTYDKQVSNVATHKYSVAGTLQVRSPP